MATSLHGVLIVNKPSGWTSHDVVAKVRNLLQERQVGHLGTLDPLATGVLPLAVGAATRLVEFASSTKEYLATCLLGKQTDSDDISGASQGEKDPSNLSPSAVRKAVLGLQKITEQIPPMVSAVKKDGQRLYEWARKGVVIERAPRPVTIEKVEVGEVRLPRVTFKVSCSAGTYVRTLCRTLGETLEVGGCLESLQRTRVGHYHLEESISLEKLSQAVERGELPRLLLPVQTLVRDWPCIKFAEGELRDICNGKKVRVQEKGEGWIRALSPLNKLSAVGMVESLEEESWFQPKKVFGMEGFS